MAYYIKWAGDHKSFDVWHGSSIGIAAMTTKGYERVDALPEIPAEEIPLESLFFSKYKVVRKLMVAGLWESVKNSLSDEQREFLYLAQDFSLNDSIFSELYNRLKTQLPEIDEMLRDCVLE